MGRNFIRDYNILLITADQLRYDALGCNAPWLPSFALAHMVKTPNLSKLLRRSVTFINCFTPNPICVPARASITTGNYPHKCTGSKSNNGRIREDQPKLAEIFANQGYATYAIGKLHYVPYSPPGQPRLLHGFQYAELDEEGRIIAKFDPKGELWGLEDYHDYLRRTDWGGYERAHGIGNNDVRAAISPLPLEYYRDAWVAKRSIAIIKRHLVEKKDQPFLLWTSFCKPHPPYDPPKPYHALYDPRKTPEPLGGWDNEEILEGRDPELVLRRRIYGWDWLSPQAVQLARSHYCSLVTLQDMMIGRILDFLEENNLIDNTIIIYTSDHGDLLGDFGRFFKRCMFNGVVKVPMIWFVPGLTDENKDNHRCQLVGLQDILPTLCSLLNMPIPKGIDGMDLTPILEDPKAPGRRFYVSYTYAVGQKAMVYTSEWKYVYSEIMGVEELYDIRKPDGELINVALDNPDIVKEMRETLIDWCIRNGDYEMISDGKLSVKPRDILPPPVFSARHMGWRRF